MTMIPDIPVERFAAFSNGDHGGNPAGVMICNTFPEPSVMQRLAAEIGYSETVFAMPDSGDWRVRYFAPAMEVPFCGHATIALGAALAARQGDGHFRLQLKNGQATVEGRTSGRLTRATLQSPPTTMKIVPPAYLSKALDLFGWSSTDLDPHIPPAIISAGANHLLLALNNRESLRDMTYNLDAGKTVMDAESLATIMIIFSETAQRFHARNPFAAGGVYEDPATGAAAAALGGYLREIHWPHGGNITIIQGEDMGIPCQLDVEITDIPGASIRVGGCVRRL